MFEDDVSKDYSKNDVSEGIEGKVLNLSVLSSGEKGDSASGENGEATSSDLVDVCLDLMMYKDAKLFEASFMLLLGEFMQRKPLIDALGKVIVFSSGDFPGFGSAKAIQDNVRLLNRDIENAQVWGVGADIDRNTEYRVLNTLHKLRMLCTAGTKKRKVYGADGAGLNLEVLSNPYDQSGELLDQPYDPRGNDPDNPLNAVKMTKIMDLAKPIISPDCQNLLRGLDLMEVLLNAIRIQFLDHETGEPHPTLQQIVISAYATLGFFTLSNDTNQQLMLEHLDIMIETLRTSPSLGIGNVVNAIFSGNRVLVENAPDALFYSMASVLDKNPNTLRFLEVRGW